MFGLGFSFFIIGRCRGPLLFQQQKAFVDGCVLRFVDVGGCWLVAAVSASRPDEGKQEVFCSADPTPPLCIGSTNADENKAEVGVCWVLAASSMRLLRGICGV